MTADESSTIELREVLWTARGGERPSSEVQDLSVRIAPRAITWLEGAPGEGKEAAFRFLSLAEIPETGEVLLEGNSHRGWSSEERARLRAQRFGFLTASPFLLPSFTAIENIAIPLLKITGVTLDEARERIIRALHFVELTELEDTAAEELSPFEQIRLGLARSLAHGPLAVFVDDLEPVLPPPQLAELAALLRRACQVYGVAVVALRGRSQAAMPGERTVHFVSGKMEGESEPLPSAVP